MRRSAFEKAPRIRPSTERVIENMIEELAMQDAALGIERSVRNVRNLLRFMPGADRRKDALAEQYPVERARFERMITGS